MRKLTAPVPTRWYSQYNSLESLNNAKYTLIRICDEKKEELLDISENATAVISSISTTSFWTKLTAIMDQIKFPVNVIGKLEKDEAEFALVYHYFGKLKAHYINDRAISVLVNKRWKFLGKDVHGLGYLLTPRFAMNGNFFTSKEEVTSSIETFVATKDPEADAEAVLLEMTAYVAYMSTLTGSTKKMIENLTASQYWNGFGKEKFPLVFAYAKGINSMVCSSAGSERVWSIFRFIHTKLRNRLPPEKVDKLAFLYVNSAYLDDKDREDYVLNEYAELFEDDFEDFADYNQSETN